MNLSTARSAERAREVGVRKSIGAFRWQLSLQFITESVVLSLIAAVIAVLLVIIFLPAVNHLSQRELTFPLFTNWKLFLSLLTGAILLGMVTGIYPAFYLSSFRPAKVLKGSVQTGRNKSTIRNVLVVGQFACAIFLIIGTAFAVKQLHFMQNRPTGFDHEEVVNVRLQNGTSDKYDILKKDLLQNTLVKGVTASQDILGSHLDQSGIQFKGDGPLRQLTSTRLIVDPDYLKLYKIPLAAGRNFSSDKSANGKEYIINEKLAKELLKDDSSKAGIASLIGKQFGFDSLGYIVGIARDFNFNSLHNKIETMFLFNQKDWGYSNMSVKVNGNKEKEAIAFIGSVWKKACADTPFDYQFLDDHFDELYRSDSQISTIVGTLAILAIIISCLGLFGLASYAAERRTKEVGIRKTLGASLENLVLLLSKDFLKYVLIASLIALPLSWFSVHKWLQSYAYRVDISWWIFVLAVLVAMLIAFVTISFQAIKSAMANPVNSLRSE
jgi:putative ABC transport system permease protein